ncbi:ABC transporter ATP-binding protein [Cognaticolwellia beringensis]|uniref:ABC transporter ATP-binding protein n=1 Tax=Cognaticolwellia beringensis TaxID=1967665 RepID=A0A222G808_9GAMM|nr:ABC transporter ATP-binding protein [Cognaticolwellia beringensis]ASP47494.1 ABC transporter ATP-binding protein [Cognaticolwellia beringensis]
MNTPLVSLENVSKHYKDLIALSAIHLHLAQGEVLGLFGHNGAGKTTLMKLILGIISPDIGNVSVMGTKPDDKSAWHMRTKMGYLPENVMFYEQLTGLEVITYFARLKGQSKTHARALLEQVGIAHAMGRPVKTYSKGMRQRLGLAQAFIGEPKLLLLDEPTVGLDPSATAEFYRSVDQLKTQGTSVVLCSHVLPGVEQHIDRAMIISGGKTLALGTIKELRAQSNLPIKIKPQGLNGSLQGDPLLQPYLDEADNLFVPEQEKLKILRHLLADDSLCDLTVESANLEQVYQCFLAQAEKMTTESKSKNKQKSHKVGG